MGSLGSILRDRVGHLEQDGSRHLLHLSQVDAQVQPRMGGHREAVRPLLISRKLAVDAATKHLILIKALIVTLPLDFREQLEGLSNAAWSSAAVCSGPGQAQPRKCSSR
jgi:hypothetical protein